MKKSRSQKIKEAIKEIVEFHDLGRELPKKPESHRDGYNRKTMDIEAESRDVSAETLRKARQFADTETGYTRREMRDLCRMIDRGQKDKDEKLPVFGRTHLLRLLTVPKEQRAELQAEAIEQAWGCRQLELEILRRFGTRRKGGRRRKIPPHLPGLLAQAEALCESWRRWHRKLEHGPREDEEKHILLADLPDELRRLLLAVNKAVGKLHQDVVERLKEADENWTPRTAGEDAKLGNEKSEAKKTSDRKAKK